MTPATGPSPDSRGAPAADTPSSHVRAGALTAAALIAFASNSILCRLALSRAEIDPATFTTIRLASGAVVLGALVAMSGSRGWTTRGNWGSAIALALYAVAFSYAYVSLDAGTGALLLFGAVQATMILTALSRGERASWQEWAGIATALGGLIYLVSPGLTAPPPAGAALMIAAGAAWGVYTLRGRGSSAPVLTTAGNFVRSAPLAVAVSAASALGGSRPTASASGVTLALASGVLASGFGYVLWYSALQYLTAVRAATVQLIVPVLGALGGILLLGESLSPRLAISAALILGGIGVAVTRRSGGSR